MLHFLFRLYFELPSTHHLWILDVKDTNQMRKQAEPRYRPRQRPL
jgi:hypothetical protein